MADIVALFETGKWSAGEVILFFFNHDLKRFLIAFEGPNDMGPRPVPFAMTTPVVLASLSSCSGATQCVFGDLTNFRPAKDHLFQAPQESSETSYLFWAFHLAGWRCSNCAHPISYGFEFPWNHQFHWLQLMFPSFFAFEVPIRYGLGSQGGVGPRRMLLKKG